MFQMKKVSHVESRSLEFVSWLKKNIMRLEIVSYSRDEIKYTGIMRCEKK